MRCFCISRPKPKTPIKQQGNTTPSPTSPPTPRPSTTLVAEVRRPGKQPAPPPQVRWADQIQPAPHSNTRSCTGLLSSSFLERLEGHADTFPLMAAELSELRRTTQRVRAAEKALATTRTGHTADLGQAELRSARQALRTQVQRVQMVLQDRQTDIGQHDPDKAQVTHLGTCQADWKRLKRVLRSIDALDSEVVGCKASPLSMQEQQAEMRWHDLCSHRQQVTQALRTAGKSARQADWPTASEQLHAARQELRALLAEARALGQHGQAMLLHPDEYASLNAVLRETPERLERLDRFQRYVDRRLRHEPQQNTG